MGRLLVQKLDPNAKEPTVVFKGQDLGYDLYASKDVFLEPHKQVIIPTGIAAVYEATESDAISRSAMWHGHPTPRFGLEIGDRSGLAAKEGLHTLAGKVDAGYRGEIGVVMILLGVAKQLHPEDRELMLKTGWSNAELDNLTPTQLQTLSGGGAVRAGYQVKAGDKIAQMLPRLVMTDEVVVVDVLPEGARGAAGYGSSDKR